MGAAWMALASIFPHSPLPPLPSPALGSSFSIPFLGRTMANQYQASAYPAPKACLPWAPHSPLLAACCRRRCQCPA